MGTTGRYLDTVLDQPALATDAADHHTMRVLRALLIWSTATSLLVGGVGVLFVFVNRLVAAAAGEQYERQRRE